MATKKFWSGWTLIGTVTVDTSNTRKPRVFQVYALERAGRYDWTMVNARGVATVRGYNAQSTSLALQFASDSGGVSSPGYEPKGG